MKLFKSFQFEMKAVAEDASTFEGYASTFGNVDRGGDIILPGAFKDTLPDFLKDGIIAWQHDWATPIGRPLDAYEDAKGLFIKGSLVDTAAGRDARTLMREGIVKKMSIGYSIVDAEWLTPENIGQYCTDESATMRDLANAMDWGRALKKIALYEVSPVSIPMNNSADITGVKGLLAGLSFADHSDAALAAVKEYAERVKSLQTLRAKDGRHLSEERLVGLAQLAAELTALAGELKGLTAPASEGTPEADARRKQLALRTRTLQMTASA